MNPNLNVALQDFPKKFWGLLGQKAHKTHQMKPFHSKRGGLSLTLTDQGQTYKPKCNHKRYPMELYGLVGMVVPTAVTTQQTFVIGQLQTKNKSLWSRCFHQYLNQYLPSPNKWLTADMSHTNIVTKNVTFCA